MSEPFVMAVGSTTALAQVFFFGIGTLVGVRFVVAMAFRV